MGLFDKAPYSFKNLILGSIDAFRAQDSLHGYDYVMERQARDDAMAARHGHSGGFGEAEHGSIDGHPVTFAKGWGTKEGHTLLADGHVDKASFMQSGNHEHYGPGDGPHNNGTSRGRYSGPGR